MDENAKQTGQEAQDAQNAAMMALLKLIASLISKASKRDVKLDDLTLMSGSKKAWPSDNPDLELTAKLKDAFTNSESKASVRIFLQYGDGKKEEIFRQTGGKVIKDPLGLAPAMRQMFAEQAADQFTAEQRPKVLIETDSRTLVQEPTVFEELAMNSKLEQAATIDEADEIDTVEQADEIDSAEQSEFVSGDEDKEQILKGKLAQAEQNLFNARQNLGSPEHDPTEAQEWVDYFERSVQDLRAQLGISESAGVEQTQAAESVNASSGVSSEQTEGAVREPSAKERMLQGKLDMVELELADAIRRANEPGGGYLRNEQWFKELEKKAQSLRAELGIPEPSASAVAQAKNAQAVETAPLKVPQAQVERTEATVQPFIEAFKVTPSIQEQNEMFVLGAIAASVSPSEVAVQESPALTTVPNAKPIVFEDWVPAFPELTEVGTLAKYEGQTLDLAPVASSPSDTDGAMNTVALQPFLTEASQLSGQIELLREQTNQKLSELAAFSQGIKETVIEPKIEQWAQQTMTTVETQAVSLGDRLKNAAVKLRDTVKERAANDWKIIVDTVKDRATEDIAKTVDVVKTRASNDWETVQKWAIGSDKVDKGIDTLIDYVGQKHPNGGIAQMDGYTFIHKNGQTGIFKGGSHEPVYKNGVLTDKASSKDAAYIAKFPQKAQTAAAAVDAYKASQSAQQSSAAAPVQSKGSGMSRCR